MKRSLLAIVLISFSINGCQGQPAKETKESKQMETKNTSKNPYYSRADTTKLQVSDEDWKKVLPSEIYQVARNKGTEWAFSGKYWNFEGIGTYYCVACGNALFKSDAKFASSCGWPSFYEALRSNSVIYEEDHTHGMHRVEVLCGRCEGHLGHIFDDGPKPTGKRFCMNSIMLDFEPDTKPLKE